jgi:1,4-dihydroxy-2-naphthoate octaprenyltransferase
VLLPLLSAPYAALVARWVIRARTHEELIPMTPQAGQVLLAYAALLGLGFAV